MNPALFKRNVRRIEKVRRERESHFKLGLTLGRIERERQRFIELDDQRWERYAQAVREHENREANLKWWQGWFR